MYEIYVHCRENTNQKNEKKKFQWQKKNCDENKAKLDYAEMKFLCETNKKQCSANSDGIFAELSLNTFTAAVYKLSYRLLYESMEKFAH